MGRPAFYFAHRLLRAEVARMTLPSTAPAGQATRDVAGPVLFFDGECGLCHRLVRLLLRLDRAGRLHFAPLQGPAAQSYLAAHRLPTVDFDTLVLVPDWSRRERSGHFIRTAGVIAALRAIGTRTARILAGLIGIFPAAVRDAAYRVVGRWRYRIFGPWQPRPLARPEWRERFLE
jgi:predicted DCC family thiol-disulfide oxidoreductase YuxK